MSCEPFTRLQETRVTCKGRRTAAIVVYCCTSVDKTSLPPSPPRSSALSLLSVSTTTRKLFCRVFIDNDLSPMFQVKLLSLLPPACRIVDVECQATAMCSVAQVTRSLILCAVIVSSYSHVLSRTSDAFFDIMCCPACQNIVDYSVVHMMFCCCCCCCLHMYFAVV